MTTWPGLFENCKQDLDRLVLQLHSEALASTLATLWINLEDSETDKTVRLCLLHVRFARY